MRVVWFLLATDYFCLLCLNGIACRLHHADAIKHIIRAQETQPDLKTEEVKASEGRLVTCGSLRLAACAVSGQGLVPSLQDSTACTIVEGDAF